MHLPQRGAFDRDPRLRSSPARGPASRAGGVPGAQILFEVTKSCCSAGKARVRKGQTLNDIMGLCISCSAIHIKLALEVRRPLFILFFSFFHFYFFFYAAYFIISNPGAKRYVWLRRASPLISAITAPRRGVRAEPLEDAGVPRCCLDKGDKRQGEKGKKNKKTKISGSILPA